MPADREPTLYEVGVALVAELAATLERDAEELDRGARGSGAIRAERLRAQAEQTRYEERAVRAVLARLTPSDQRALSEPSHA
jgi:hypothetical protein